MITTPESIAAILEESRDEIKAAAVEALKKRVADELSYSMSKEINAVVTKFIAEEIATEVPAMLADEKAGILALIEKSVAQIGAAVSTKMLETANEQLNGYGGREIIAKLFGGR